jgi:hypothetical protein
VSIRKAALAVLISGDQKQLERTLIKAGGGLDKFGKKAEHTNSRVGTSFGGMAKRAAGAGVAAVGAYASIAGAKKAIDTTTTLAKTTLSLNKNLGLGVEQASRWAAVAKSRDIDSKALNQSFVALSKNVVAAGNEDDKYRAKLDALGSSEKDQAKRQDVIAKGAGKTVDAFAKLGISQKELAGSDFDQTLRKAADGLKALPPGADRAALSAKLFGKGWQTIVPILRGGSKAMDEQLALADKYGVTLKGKTVKSLEEMIAAQRESKFATMGLQVAVGQELVPALTKGVKAGSKFVAQMRSGKGAGGEFAEVVGDVWREAKPIVTWLGRATAATGRFVEKHPEVGKLAAAVLAVGGALKGLKFIGAITGFSTIVKAGRAAAKKLPPIFAAEGVASGAAANAGIAGGITKSNRFGTAGRAAGKKLGRGLVLGAVLALPLLLPEILGFARKASDKVNDIVFGGVKKGAGAVSKIIGKLNPFGDGLGKGPLPSGKAGNLMGAQGALAPFAAAGRGFGLSVTSGRRSGAAAITSSGNPSFHGTGEAIDQAGPPGRMLAYFRQMKARYGSRLAELIYTPGGIGIRNGRPHRYTGKVAAEHFDHVHLAYDTGRPGVGDGYGKGQIMNLWTRAGGSPGVANLAAAVSLAESGGKSDALNRNSNGTVDRGLWQINSIHGRLSTFDPAGNARAAVKISSAGRNWQPWAAYTNRRYRQYLDDPAGAKSIAGGRTPAGSSRTTSEATGSKIVKRIAAPFLGGSRGLTSLSRAAERGARVIGEKDTAYGQAERRFGLSDEDLGTAAGRAQRTSELAHLKRLKQAQLKRQQTLKKALEQAVKKYDRLIAKLRAQLRGKNRAKGGAAARIRERIKEYDDLRLERAAEARSLGSTIEDTKLDLGELDKEASGVASTADADAPSTTDKVSNALSHVDALERAGDLSPTDAQTARVGILNTAIAGGFGATTPDELLGLRGDLREATSALAQATVDNTAALRELQASIDANTAAAASISGVTHREAIRLMADVILQAGGQRVVARNSMNGTGALSKL